jgi:ABC-type sugar transport system ATPase subunit
VADIQFVHIGKVYDGDVTAVRDLNLDVAEGEFMVLVGPSGCGKTTALRMIAGLEEISSGEIHIGGKVVNDLAPRDRDIAMVFQNYALYPHKSVYENLAFGLRMRKVPKAEQKQRVEEIARILGLGDMLQRRPAQLSGGQRQRVAIARAVAHPPAILLMDEPLGALDLKLREAMQQELRAIQKKLGITTLYVTHDQTEAMVMSDRIVVMRNGRVEQIGSPSDIYRRPASRFVASFVGRINFLPVLNDNGPRCRASGIPLKLPPQEQPLPATLTLAIRPEWLRILAAGEAADGHNVLDARIVESVFIGSHVSLKADVGGGTILTLHGDPDGALPSAGETARISWSRDQAIILTDD